MSPETLGAVTELVQEILAMREEMAWVRQTIHHAYHGDRENSGFVGPIEQCPKGVCSTITRRLDTDVISASRAKAALQGRRPK